MPRRDTDTSRCMFTHRDARSVCWGADTHLARDVVYSACRVKRRSIGTIIPLNIVHRTTFESDVAAPILGVLSHARQPQSHLCSLKLDGEIERQGMVYPQNLHRGRMARAVLKRVKCMPYHCAGAQEGTHQARRSFSRRLGPRLPCRSPIQPRHARGSTFP